MQRADAKKVLGSARKMNVGGNVVALDGDKIYTQSKETSEKSRSNYEQGQCAMCVWAPVTEGEVAKETAKELAAENEVH